MEVVFKRRGSGGPTERAASHQGHLRTGVQAVGSVHAVGSFHADHRVRGSVLSTERSLRQPATEAGQVRQWFGFGFVLGWTLV